VPYQLKEFTQKNSGDVLILIMCGSGELILRGWYFASSPPPSRPTPKLREKRVNDDH